MYMNGDTFTALDVTIGYALLAMKRKFPFFFDKFPDLLAYIERLEKRPAYIKSNQN